MTDAPQIPNVDPVFYESMLQLWRDDPGVVDASWQRLFQAFGEEPGARSSPVVDGAANAETDAAGTLLRRAYRERGHLIADSNPLARSDVALDLAEYGLANGALSGSPVLAGLEAGLHEAYCGTLSAEFMYLDDAAPRDWLGDALESGFGAPAADKKSHILDLLVEAECFEHFMQTKLPTSKRFGMEGSESQMPLCERLLECAAAGGVDEVVLGPMHRGRTTFMALFMNKPLAAIFSEFQGRPWHADDLGIAGDVTYHMGHSVDRMIDGRMVHISMASHPSHVETVIPVSLGKVRARQTMAGAKAARNVLGLMMHTDAGFAGQGVVAECFQLSGVEGYRTGGSIHVIANNQVGFTTRAEDARSSRYCSDMAKIVQAPVLRVNGDDPEAAYRTATIAVAFWREFRRDIVVDLVCYRRQGHNELDEPRYTQPQMYAEIDRLPTVRALYTDRLLGEGVISPGWDETRRAVHWQRFEAGFSGAQGYRPNKPGRFDRHWKGVRYCDLETVDTQPVTGVPLKSLKALGAAQAAWPDGFQFNGRLIKQLEVRAATIACGEAVGWAAAESLALASLLADGVPVRLTGEDTRRGTFSQRHGVLHDEVSGACHVPLNHVSDGQAAIEIHDSPLSEEAVLGFEYGFSLADPRTLVIWEAQFGDFANVAQVFIDQYIAPGEEKWLRSAGLVLLLPHGLEGGGPEHSSARLERFLQLCAKGNMHVVNCTTPANHFHALRRQMRRDYRKPLIAMTPKLLLRHRETVSPLKEMAARSRFKPVLADVRKARDATRVIVCSGRVFYDLDAARMERGMDHVAIIRIEELYPFPARALADALKAHPQARIVWCQEEPQNMGAWQFVDRRLEAVVQGTGGDGSQLAYVGRAANPSPAPGFKSNYERQQTRLLQEALEGTQS